MLLAVIFGLFLVVVVITLYQWYERTFTASSHPSLVRARGYPLIGSLLHFLPSRIMHTARHWPVIYGPLIEYYIFNARSILISDAAIAKEILSKRPKKFRRLRSLESANKVLRTEKGLFQSNGDEWKHLRKATAPSFNHNNVIHKLKKISEEFFHWMDRITPSIHEKKEIDMKFQAFSLTIRVISIVAFGLDTNNEISAYFFSNQMLQDIENIFRYSFESALFFFPRFIWKYTSSYQTEVIAREGDARFLAACTKMINYKRECQVNNPNEVATSMIDSMLAKELQGSDAALTDEEIIANVKTIYMAGSDTTSVVISWIVYYFSIYPHLLQEAREEAKRLLFHQNEGNSFQTRQDCIEAMNQPDLIVQLTFCSACVKEVLRIAGPASMNSCQTANLDEEVTLSNGIVIGPNDTAWINNDGIHYSPDAFPQPFEFLPHRWLTKDPIQLQKMEDSFVAFGYGPRICPGMFLANIEAVLAVAFLAYHFNMELNCPKEEVFRVRSFTAVPNKVPVIFTLANPILQ